MVFDLKLIRIMSARLLRIKSLLSKHCAIPSTIVPQLDALRGISALVVLVGHANQILIGPTNHSLSSVTGLLAQSAVMVFFVLSGFLICKSITRNSAENGGFNVGAYTTDRVCRILPPFLFSLLLVAVLYCIAPLIFQSGTTAFPYAAQFTARAGFEIDTRSVLGAMFFLNGFITDNISANGPLWSLSYEVWYYIIAGLVASATKRRGGLLVATLVIFALGALNQKFLLYSVVWFGGAAVAIMHNHAVTARNMISILMYVALTFSACLGGFYIFKFLSYTSPSEIDGRIIVLYNVFFGIGFSAFLHLMLNTQLHIKPFLRKSAGFSYTLYIIHFPILLFLYGVLQPYIHNNLLLSILAAVSCVFGCIFVSGSLARILEDRRLLNTYREKLTMYGAGGS